MNRNIPSLYSLSQNALYNTRVIPADLRQDNYPAQLVERYEDFARERAAIDTQKKWRARGAKVKIVNILNRIESRRRAAGLPRLYGENKLLNYNLTTGEGTNITRELVKLDIQDFMYQSFWWKLVRRGLEFFLPATQGMVMNVLGGARRTTNGGELLNIIRSFVTNIDQYVRRGFIHSRDLGARNIKRMRRVFLPQVALQPLMIGATASGAAAIWYTGFGQLGRIVFGPERRRAAFGGAVMSKEAPINIKLCRAEQLRLYGESLPPDIVDLIKKQCYASLIQDKAKQLRKKKLRYIYTLLRRGAERIPFAVINNLVEVYDVLDDDSTIITEEMFRYLTKKDYMNKSLWWKIVLRGLEQIQAIHDRAKREFNPRDHDPGTEPWITVLDNHRDERYFRPNQELLVEIFNRYIRLDPQPKIIYKPGIDSDPEDPYMTPHTWEGPFVESWRNFDELATEPRRDESWYDQTERLGVERRVLRPGIRFSYGKKSKR